VSNKSGFSIINKNWAQLENNFAFLEGKIAVYSCGMVRYISNKKMKCTEVPVKEGEIWRISTRIMNEINWPREERGLILRQNNDLISYIPIDVNSGSCGVSTFVIPKDAVKIVVNGIIHTTNQEQTHILKLCDWVNIWDATVYRHIKNKYIDGRGVLQNTELKLAVTDKIPIKADQIYRIANVHYGDGKDFLERGVFLDDNNQVIGMLPNNPKGSIPYAWNDVIVPEGATGMCVNFYYKMATRNDTSESISINLGIPAEIEYSNELRKLFDKVWAAYGDSTTYYGDWNRLVENATGLKTFINSYGGACISLKKPENTLCNDERISLLMSCNPDIVTILTGLNSTGTPLGDIKDLTVAIGSENKYTFYGAYSYILKRILTIKPSVKIIILTTTMSYYDYKNDEPNESGLSSLDYAQASKLVAEYFGIPVADIRHSMQLNKYTQDILSADNVHFSMRGAEAIAGCVIRVMKDIDWVSK
jgi:lysophospholipase L1-like esterase